jgi:hypothetical protein
MLKPKPLTGFWNVWWRILSSGYKDGLPFLELPEGKKPPDAFQKAAHILRNRPLHFWAVSPNHRLAFDVHYLRASVFDSPRFRIFLFTETRTSFRSSKRSQRSCPINRGNDQRPKLPFFFAPEDETEDCPKAAAVVAMSGGVFR